MRYLLASRERFGKIRLFILRTISNFLIFGGISVFFLALWPQVRVELRYAWDRWRRVEYFLDGSAPDEEKFSPFSILSRRPVAVGLSPASRDFGLVIEKIGVNIPVVANVSVASKRDYNEALRHGAAHVRGTVFPGQVGNSYIFAHSSLNFWRLGEYSTAFNLLRKLEVGDKISVLYKGWQYDYFVYDTQIVSGFDTTPLVSTFDRPVLTLQTCYPPGTTLNRLVVYAAMR